MWPFEKKKKPLDPQTKDALDRKARELAPDLLRFGNDAGDNLFRVLMGREARVEEAEKELLVAVDTLFFCTHLVDRMRLGRWDASWVRLLWATCGRRCTGCSIASSRVQKKRALKASGTYSQFERPIPQKDSDSPDGTLFWEFTKRVVATYGNANNELLKPALRAAVDIGEAIPQITKGILPEVKP
jgi:hypothetical protein